MIENLSDEARLVLKLAEQEARQFQHEYIGTEHLLLGLIEEGNGVAAIVLRARGLDAARLRHEVNQIVQPGLAPIQKRELPLTPRTRQAMEFAADEARAVGHSLIGAEHLLLGLLREPDGVAGLILHKCGLQLEELRAEVLKIRHLQMKVVERVVRPLRANSARKRKMRDELLAHLSAIYDEEFARLHDPIAAVDAAGRRFGSPAELTAELQLTVPRMELFEDRVEAWLGWRAPETAVHWMYRVAVQLTLLMFFMCLLVAFVASREFGWGYSVWLTIRPLVAAAIVLPVSIAVSGISHYKIRDHLFGVFGSRKSWGRVFAWVTLSAVVTMAVGFTFFTVAYGTFSPASAAFYPCIAAGILWALGISAFAQIFGPQEIRDATWALLDLREESAVAD